MPQAQTPIHLPNKLGSPLGVNSMDEIKVNERLDLRGVLCPINFVKTKLKLEEMRSGEVLEIILDDGEPIMNVPRSVKEEGHRIVRVENMEEAFKLFIKKS